MNVFYLDVNPKKAAIEHCDKHVVKMVIEYAQLMSTAHRILDGKQYTEIQNGRRIKRWRLEDDGYESILYKASHINHPSAIWSRSSNHNYEWLYELWLNLCNEFTNRYGKKHLTETKLINFLKFTPKNIRKDKFTEPPPAMPEYCKIEGDSVASYRKYYLKEKPFARWEKSNNIPDWFASQNYTR